MKTPDAIILFLKLLVVFAIFCNCANAANALENSGGCLPWAFMAEIVNKGGTLCSNTAAVGVVRPSDSDSAAAAGRTNYAHRPGQMITITLSGSVIAESCRPEVEIYCEKWAAGAWRQAEGFRGRVRSNQIRLGSKLDGEGFFRLQFALKNADGELRNYETYAIVCKNWKRDIIAFCRRQKDRIESAPDPELFRACIAVSHFDHVMEDVGKNVLLSDAIVKALVDAIRSRESFDSGKCPDLVTGLNKIRLKRFEGASVAEFAVFVPENYDASLKWPLFVNVDPRRVGQKRNYAQHSGLIDVWWHFPKYVGYQWKDYEYFLGILKNRINVDQERIYIFGLCSNAIGAMSLGLKYPDRWAECTLVLGNSCRNQAGNALNLPVIYIQGEHNAANMASYYDSGVKAFEYYRCRNFKYSRSRQTEQTIIRELRGMAVPQCVRERNPRRVRYTTNSLGEAKAYWVKILGRKNENFFATVDASVEHNVIDVTTENVASYTLNLVEAPVDSNAVVEIVENGTRVGFANGRFFRKEPPEYAAAAYLKNEQLHGPAWDAFSDAYFVLYGTGDSDTDFVRESRNLAMYLANGELPLTGADVRQEQIARCNIVLVGTPRTNPCLSEICDSLPVKIEPGRFIADGTSYDGRDTGLMLIYPNPLNPSRYVAVFSATSSEAMAKMSQLFSRMKTMEPADVAIFELAENGTVIWHVIERFDTTWNWQSRWNKVLTVAEREHPEWQWRQLAARVIRERLGADVGIYEQPLRFPNCVPSGQITSRKLHKNFTNDWVVKIKMDGKSLKELLAPSADVISEQPGSWPAIDGLSFVGTRSRCSPLPDAVGEIADAGKYTIAMPERAVAARREGTALADYEITGDGYLVQLLCDYFSENRGIDIDNLLDSLMCGYKRVKEAKPAI